MSQAETKMDVDFNFCLNCQEICGITADFKCESCGENICVDCGCTDSEGCAEGCYWVRPGMCSECD